MSKHLIVISCENNYYHSWQAKVATYSCLAHQGVAPLLVVHGSIVRPLKPGFLDCVDAGAHVARSRNYRWSGGVDWAARNTVGTLLDARIHAERLGADFIVLMDPDLVWTRPVSWPSELAVDRCVNDLTNDDSSIVAGMLGIDLPPGSNRRLGSRVPYVVPTELADEIGREWWRVMDTFADRRFVWADQMRAWGLALASLGLEPALRRFSQTNYHGDEKVSASLIHYAHEYRTWHKGWFQEPEDGSPFDPPRISSACVQGWAHREIVRAGAFFAALERSQCA